MKVTTNKDIITIEYKDHLIELKDGYATVYKPHPVIGERLEEFCFFSEKYNIHLSMSEFLRKVDEIILKWK